MRLFNANFWRGTHTYAAWRGKFAFPQNATLEQNLRFLRYANLEIRATQCLLPSVVKDRSFRSTVSDRNVSAPGGAQNRFGADAACNKKTRRRAPGESVHFLGATFARL